MASRAESRPVLKLMSIQVTGIRKKFGTFTALGASTLGVIAVLARPEWPARSGRRTDATRLL